MLKSGDIKFFYTGPQKADIKIGDEDLVRDPGLENSVLISLFTDGRASTEDPLPHDAGDLRGWWGDELLESPFPSKLWLLERSKITDENMKAAEQYVNDALAWMVEDDLADSIDVVTARANRKDQINFSVTIAKTSGTTIFFKWFVNWNLQIFGGL